jgi:hypothetical protein
MKTMKLVSTLAAAIACSFPAQAEEFGACTWDNESTGEWRCENARIVDLLSDVVPRSVSFQLGAPPDKMCDSLENAYLTYTPPASLRGKADRKRNVIHASAALRDALIHGLHVDVIGRTIDSDRPGTCEVHGFHLQPAD